MIHEFFLEYNPEIKCFYLNDSSEDSLALRYEFNSNSKFNQLNKIVFVNENNEFLEVYPDPDYYEYTYTPPQIYSEDVRESYKEYVNIIPNDDSTKLPIYKTKIVGQKINSTKQNFNEKGAIIISQENCKKLINILSKNTKIIIFRPSDLNSTPVVYRKIELYNSYKEAILESLVEVINKENKGENNE